MTSSLSDLPLGRAVDYPREYDAGLLFPIARTLGRHEIGLAGDALPFIGHDRWHAYELGWLDGRGKPRVATATLQVPADSPNLIESKSLKLYLNSFNAARWDSDEAVRARIAADLTSVAGATVSVAFGLPGIDAARNEAAPENAPSVQTPNRAAAAHVDAGGSPQVRSREAEADADDGVIDGLDIAIEHYGPPRADFIATDPAQTVTESLSSALLKSNCPVTGQPDWARVVIAYRGPRLDREGLLRYLVSFRDHSEFHEQCVERIFTDLLAQARPEWLSVEARYTRRGGLDINPWRGTPGCVAPTAGRDLRQ